MRPRNVVLLGVVVGLAFSLIVLIGERATLAQGQNAAGVEFGASHVLFFVGLPWSAGVVACMWGVLGLLHVDGSAAMRPFFFAMPIVAGAAWGAIAAVFVDNRRLRRRLSPSAK